MTPPYDIAIIGSGPGGYVAALRAAQMGARVALIEKGLVGGACLNRGCIPTKSFLAAAELLHDIRHRAGKLGISAGEPEIDWPAALAHKNGVLGEQRKGLRFLFDKRGIDLISGEASFEAPGRLAVRDGSGARAVQAERIIIASGSRPSRIPGWPENERVVTSDEALDWTELPASLLIVGGGVIGCEFACMMAEFGVRVTVVEMLPRLLPLMDGDLGKEIAKVFKQRGIDCHLGAKVEDLTVRDDRARATLSNSVSLEVDKVLVAVGRRANIEDLALEKGGVRGGERWIGVNDRMETNVAGHYAIGDVTGRMQLAHEASAMGCVAVENALGRPRVFDAPVPGCVYTFPEIGSVGLGEEEAKEKGLPIAVGSFPYLASGKARAYGDASGFVKIVRHRETNEILGVHAVGHSATEFIAAAGVLLHTRATARDAVDMVFAHPTMGEAIRDATEASLFECLHLPPPRRLRVRV
ncbi:MAG TPA: dihydrolipoyl dehydrogenase [Sumerlaeia bacterium]|nr:dihydrolipoyl dehydrogenase [Sumerlaeia bacterium]